jgi:hypothetical protein
MGTDLVADALLDTDEENGGSCLGEKFKFDNFCGGVVKRSFRFFDVAR